MTSGFIHESWVKLCRNRLETQIIKSIFHCLKNNHKTQKEILNKKFKMSFYFWAWLCIPLFHHTGVNGAAPLPQGQRKPLVRNSSLLEVLFVWGAQRKARRKTCKDCAVGLGVPAAPGPCGSPSPCPLQSAAGHCLRRAKPAWAAGAAHRLCGKEDARSLLPAEPCLQFTCLEAPREGFRVDPLKPLVWRTATLHFPGWEQQDFARNRQV